MSAPAAMSPQYSRHGFSDEEVHFDQAGERVQDLHVVGREVRDPEEGNSSRKREIAGTGRGRASS